MTELGVGIGFKWNDLVVMACYSIVNIIYLLVTLGAIKFGNNSIFYRYKNDVQNTFGWKRAELIGAVINAGIGHFYVVKIWDTIFVKNNIEKETCQKNIWPLK